MVGEVNSILIETANLSAKFVKRSNKQVHCRKLKKKSNKKSWFSESCEELRTSVKNYEKLVNKFPVIHFVLVSDVDVNTNRDNLNKRFVLSLRTPLTPILNHFGN